MSICSGVRSAFQATVKINVDAECARVIATPSVGNGPAPLRFKLVYLVPDLVLAAPQPTKGFEERSLKMPIITNMKNKKYWPLQFFFDGASAAAGGHVPPAIGASNAPSGQKSPDLSQPVAMHYSYRREKRFGYIYNALCALIEWWKGGEKLTNSIIDIKKKRLLGFRPGPGHV
ncbi:hypothetical protein C8J57DRAFT_1247206 [Mycena rebaudengoi]|nr:hypothetical protein C8J57DRAFT_1247206 [Mycena rebaudengoi]